MIFNIILLFVFAGWAIGKIAQSLIPKQNDSFDDDLLNDYNKGTTVIHNYTTNIQNNLNITEEQLKKLKS